MKKLTVLTFILLFSLFTFAQKPVKVHLNGSTNNFEVINKSQQSLTLKSTLVDLILVQTSTKGGDFVNLFSHGLVKSFDAGMPNIPVESHLIEVPQDAEVQINIISYDEEIINLSDYGFTNKIVPAQPSVSKNDDPATLPFYYNEQAYATNDFMNQTTAIYEDAGMMRATRFGRIEVRPIQYNPVTNQLRVLNNLVIEVVFKNADYAKTSALKQKYASYYFDDILDHELLNYDNGVSRALIQDVPVKLVIVSDRMFEAQLEPFIEWKELKGFNVTTLYTDDIGSTTTAIKSALQTIYESDNPMDFVLFVGDVQQIPAWDGNAGSHVTDLRYCEYTGDDVPEVFYGRFSAQNTDQLQPQIDKTLMYEQYTMSDPSYLANQVLVAGVDAGNAPVYGNGAINYISTNYANSDNNINPLTYLYGDAANSTVMASDNSGASASIISYINQGVGWANYTAHGSPSGWYDPSFEIDAVNSLTNDQKYGLWIGNCCLSVKFDESECFGEVALRKANGGAIGDIGGSNSTYWDEDYWWATGVGTCVENPNYDDFSLGSYDAVYHTKTNEVNDPNKWYVTQAQVNTCGQLAVNASSSSRKQYYWEIYHLMGDPTLMPYLFVPNTTTYTLTPNVLMIGSANFDISTVPYATVAIHQDGNRLAVVMTDENGDANLNLSSALTGSEVTLVITAQNHQPLIETLQPIASSEPYVLVSAYTPDSANYNTTTNLDLDFKNVADPGFDAANVTATLSTTDPYITIIDNSTDVGAINGGQTVSIADAFEIQISNNVPDQHVANFTVSITGDDAKYSWTSNLNITLNAPVLLGSFNGINDAADGITFASSPVTTVATSSPYTYNVEIAEIGGNNNGRLDPGENVIITIDAQNIGHAGIFNTYGHLTTTSTDVTINNPETYVESLPVGGNFASDFNIEVSADAVVGSTVDFQFIIGNGNYNDTLDYTLPIGLIVEDFESGTLTNYNWQFSGTPDWSISTDAYEGSYCAQSGTPDESNGANSMFITLNNVPANSTMSFMYKVSTEAGYDDFIFSVNGTDVLTENGEVDWTEYEYTFTTAGNYTIAFKYERDCCDGGGNNNILVDNVIFPIMPSKAKSSRAITIDATTIPAWLSFTDNGDGTGLLSGTSPDADLSYPVSLTATDGTNSVTQDFNIFVGTAGINNLQNIVSIYPNPTAKILNISVDEFNTASFVLTDLVGKVILVKNINSSKTQVDLSNYAKGVYILNLNIDGTVKQEKIIVE